MTAELVWDVENFVAVWWSGIELQLKVFVDSVQQKLINEIYL